MPTRSLQRWALPLLLPPLMVLLAGCCTTPLLPAAAAQAELPEVGEAWPRRIH